MRRQITTPIGTIRSTGRREGFPGNLAVGDTAIIPGFDNPNNIVDSTGWVRVTGTIVNTGATIAFTPGKQNGLTTAASLNIHMWTAPASQGFGQRFDQIACVH